VKLTVFGSAGRTGGHVLGQGIQRGHQITAFTRRLDAPPHASELAAVVHGDGRDPEAVTRAVAGADAVIAIVSSAARAGPHQTAEVSKVIVASMTAAGARRLVITSAYPIVGDRPRVPIALLRMALRASYADLAQMERIVSGSDLDWTIARLNRLLDRPPRGEVIMTRDLLGRPAGITRADAAAALLDLAETGTYARSSVNISGT
jgi:putative NADH-flavin reductase